MEKIAFICVNYNNAQITIEWVKSILDCDGYDCSSIDIIIVDNNSAESDLLQFDSMIKNHPEVNIIYSDENIGYFGGLNIGLKEISTKGPYAFIVIGNNDITFNKTFIRNLKSSKYDDDVFVVAPNIVTNSGRLQNPFIIEKVNQFDRLKLGLYYCNYYVGHMFKIFYKPLKPIQRVIKKTKIDIPIKERLKIKRGIGACYILTRKFILLCGQLDDRVFLWGEEALLSHQVESCGGVTVYDPILLVRHHESMTVSLIQSKEKYLIAKESYKIYKEYL